MSENNYKYYNYSKNYNNIIYKKRKFLTNTELEFYKMIKELEPEYNVIPQVNLNTVIRKINSNNRLNLFRNIDFGIFDKDFKEILLLIELNDKTHDLPERKRRDYSVKEICKKANIKLLIFHVGNRNEKNFVLNLIKETIKN